MTARRITYIVGDYAACGWYRARTPAKALAERGHDVVLYHAPSSERLSTSDILVFQRPQQPAALGVLKQARSVGIRVVVDLDDDLWNIHLSNPAHEVWDGRALAVLEECIRQADLVTVSTPELAEQLAGLNKRTVVLPNMLPDDTWLESDWVSHRDKLTVGWAGSRTHLDDLARLAGVPETILRRFPNVEFAFVGTDDVPFEPNDRLRFLEPVSIEHYPDLLRNFDIGIAPVTDTLFNHCKSDLKFIEYSMVGIPTVASRVPTYERSVVHGDNGLLARNPKDWIKYLSRLIEDVELRERLGKQARQLAESRLMSRNVHLWEQAYGIG